MEFKLCRFKPIIIYSFFVFVSCDGYPTGSRRRTEYNRVMWRWCLLIQFYIPTAIPRSLCSSCKMMFVSNQFVLTSPIPAICVSLISSSVGTFYLPYLLVTVEPTQEGRELPPYLPTPLNVRHKYTESQIDVTLSVIIADG